MKNICLFCKKSSKEFTSEEHIIPEGLGYRYVLKPGNVCDECNNSFSKLDQSLQQYHFLPFLKPYYSQKKRQYELGNMKIEKLPGGKVSMKCKECNISKERDRIILFEYTIRRKPSKLQFVSRCLHKIALEAFCYYYGKKIALDKMFDATRNYVRWANKHEYRIFGQKNINMHNRDSDIKVGATTKGVYTQINIYDINFLVSINKILKCEELREKDYEVIGYAEFSENTSKRKSNKLVEESITFHS